MILFSRRGESLFPSSSLLFSSLPCFSLPLSLFIRCRGWSITHARAFDTREDAKLTGVAAHHVLHHPLQGDGVAAAVPLDALGSPGGARGVKEVGWVRGRDRNTVVPAPFPPKRRDRLVPVKVSPAN